MIKNYAIMTLSLSSQSNTFIEEPVHFTEYGLAFDCINAWHLEHFDKELEQPKKETPLRVRLRDKILELWICQMPEPETTLN